MGTAIPLARLEEITGASGVAPAIEAMLPAGVRQRQLHPRTLLAGMQLALTDRRPAHLTEVHAALTSLPRADQERPGVTADWHGGPHRLTYRQAGHTHRIINDLVSPRRLARADRYALRIPDAYADSVRWRRRRAGRIEAAHPAFLVLGGAAALTYQVLDADEVRGAEVARAARLSASAVSAALWTLAEHGLAERGPGGWRRGPVALDDVAESTGAADVHRQRAERYRKDRESWRARLRQYQGARARPVSERDGWWSLDDPDEYDFMACRWPVLSDGVVRGPPARSAPAESA